MLLSTNVHRASHTGKEWMSADDVMEKYYDAFRTHEWEHSDLDRRLAIWHTNTTHTGPMVALGRDPFDARKIQHTPHGHTIVDDDEPAVFYGRPPIMPTGTFWAPLSKLELWRRLLHEPPWKATRYLPLSLHLVMMCHQLWKK